MVYLPRDNNRRRSHTTPVWVLGVFDAGDKALDRYTAVLYHPQAYPVARLDLLTYLGCCATGASVSQFGELPGRDRLALGAYIAWELVPAELRKHIVSRTKPDDVFIRQPQTAYNRRWEY